MGHRYFSVGKYNMQHYLIITVSQKIDSSLQLHIQVPAITRQDSTTPVLTTLRTLFICRPILCIKTCSTKIS